MHGPHFPGRGLLSLSVFVARVGKSQFVHLAQSPAGFQAEPGHVRAVGPDIDHVAAFLMDANSAVSLPQRTRTMGDPAMAERLHPSKVRQRLPVLERSVEFVGVYAGRLLIVVKTGYEADDDIAEHAVRYEVGALIALDPIFPKPDHLQTPRQVGAQQVPFGAQLSVLRPMRPNDMVSPVSSVLHGPKFLKGPAHFLCNRVVEARLLADGGRRCLVLASSRRVGTQG